MIRGLDSDRRPADDPGEGLEVMGLNLSRALGGDEHTADAGNDQRLAGARRLGWGARSWRRAGRGGLELGSGVPLVGDDGLAAAQAAAQQSDRGLALSRSV